MKVETYQIPHMGCSVQKHPIVIRPLYMVDIRTIVRLARPIIHFILLPEQSHILGPVPGSFRPFCICHVSRIPCQSCGEVEEAAIRNSVLVLISTVERIYLPFQPPAASVHIPSRSLLVEYRLRHR